MDSVEKHEYFEYYIGYWGGGGLVYFFLLHVKTFFLLHCVPLCLQAVYQLSGPED